MTPDILGQWVQVLAENKRFQVSFSMEGWALRKEEIPLGLHFTGIIQAVGWSLGIEKRAEAGQLIRSLKIVEEDGKVKTRVLSNKHQ